MRSIHPDSTISEPVSIQTTTQSETTDTQQKFTISEFHTQYELPLPSHCTDTSSKNAYESGDVVTVCIDITQGDPKVTLTKHTNSTERGITTTITQSNTVILPSLLCQSMGISSDVWWDTVEDNTIKGSILVYNSEQLLSTVCSIAEDSSTSTITVPQETNTISSILSMIPSTEYYQYNPSKPTEIQVGTDSYTLHVPREVIQSHTDRVQFCIGFDGSDYFFCILPSPPQFTVPTRRESNPSHIRIEMLHLPEQASLEVRTKTGERVGNSTQYPSGTHTNISFDLYSDTDSSQELFVYVKTHSGNIATINETVYTKQVQYTTEKQANKIHSQVQSNKIDSLILNPSEYTCKRPFTAAPTTYPTVNYSIPSDVQSSVISVPITNTNSAPYVELPESIGSMFHTIPLDWGTLSSEIAVARLLQ